MRITILHMKPQAHILNGDCLLHQLENHIEGEMIVCRECMIEGNTKGETLDEIFANRVLYFQKEHEVNKTQYLKKTQKELLSIQNIPTEYEINLWFEDDLFCQTNFWFVAHLLKELKIQNPIFLVRPSKRNEYNFGKMNAAELGSSFQNKTAITLEILDELQKLWRAYQQNDTSAMLSIAQILHPHFPFIGPAVYAQISKYLRLPKKSLEKIMSELNTSEFGPIFQEFCRREAIYGFGDSQVKRMFDQIMKENNEQ